MLETCIEEKIARVKEIQKHYANPINLIIFKREKSQIRYFSWIPAYKTGDIFDLFIHEHIWCLRASAFFPIFEPSTSRQVFSCHVYPPFGPYAINF